MDLKDLFDSNVHIIFTGLFSMEIFHRECTPGNGICRSIPIAIRKLGKFIRH